MALVIAEFFQVVGLEQTPPSDLAELIPYLITIFLAVFLVSAVFGVIGKLAELLLNYRRW